MNTRNRSKRGMTLVELSVVLAVLAIVSTMVVSYVLMISARRRSAEETLARLSDFELVESLTESFIEEHPECSVGAKNGHSALLDGETALYIDDGFLHCGDTKVALEIVGGMTFSIEETAADRLYVCTLTYGEGSYVFCVNPYVGEGALS